MAQVTIVQDRQPASAWRGGDRVEPELLRLAQNEWDCLVQELGGQIYHSWNWGEFQRHHGWNVERVAVSAPCGTAAAQILIRRYGPLSTAFIRRGPLVHGNPESVLPLLWRRVEDTCRRHRVVNLNVEPQHAVNAFELGASHCFGEPTQRYTPRRSVIVSLADDEILVQRMHASKRREIRKAEKRGITIEAGRDCPSALDAFYELMLDTSRRNKIKVSTADFYGDFLECFGASSELLLAYVEGHVAAGLIVGAFGKEASYMFGGVFNRAAGSRRDSVPAARCDALGTERGLRAVRPRRHPGCGSGDVRGRGSPTSPQCRLQ